MCDPGYPTPVASCCRCQQWAVADRVLTEMQRRGLRPLDVRPSRLTAAPGEACEARDRVLRLLERLRSSPLPQPSKPVEYGGEGETRDKPTAAACLNEHEGDGRHVPYHRDASSLDTSASAPSERTTVERQGVSSKIVNVPLTGELDGAISTDGEKSLDDMLTAGIRPGPDAFLSELKAAATAKDAARSLRLLDSMRRAGHAPHPGAYACAIRWGGASA